MGKYLIHLAKESGVCLKIQLSALELLRSTPLWIIKLSVLLLPATCTKFVQECRISQLKSSVVPKLPQLIHVYLHGLHKLSHNLCECVSLLQSIINLTKYKRNSVRFRNTFLSKAKTSSTNTATRTVKFVNPKTTKTKTAPCSSSPSQKKS